MRLSGRIEPPKTQNTGPQVNAAGGKVTSRQRFVLARSRKPLLNREGERRCYRWRGARRKEKPIYEDKISAIFHRVRGLDFAKLEEVIEGRQLPIAVIKPVMRS